MKSPLLSSLPSHHPHCDLFFWFCNCNQGHQRLNQHEIFTIHSNHPHSTLYSPSLFTVPSITFTSITQPLTHRHKSVDQHVAIPLQTHFPKTTTRPPPLAIGHNMRSGKPTMIILCIHIFNHKHQTIGWSE